MELTDIKAAVDGAHAATTEKIGALEGNIKELGKRTDDKFMMLEQRLEGLPIGEEPESKKRFSILKAAAHMLGVKDVDAGYEIEVSQELERERGTKAAGMLMPLDLDRLTTKATTTAAASGSTIGTQHGWNNFIENLRDSTFVLQKARILPNQIQNLSIPRRLTSSTGNWFAADGGDSITESSPTFDSVTMTPHFVGGLTTLSYKLMLQGQPSIDRLVSDDLARTLGLELDDAALTGDGATVVPLGLLNTAGVTTTNYTIPGTPTYSEVTLQEQRLAIANALSSSVEYVCSSNVLSGLKTTDKGTDTGQFLLAGRRLNDYPVTFTNLLPDNTLLLGDWSQFMVGIWNSIEILASLDQGDNFTRGNVSIRAIMSCDFGVRQPAAFDVLQGS